MDEPALVKLIVKASNQQYEDQAIDCHLDWTVRRLKEHLSDVYPSKPKPDDQKLIYSGQLLKDKLILKDILRHYEGVQSQTHTFHLVCTPKQRFPMSFGSFASHQKPANQQNIGTSTGTVTANDGLRQRHSNQRLAPGTSTTAVNQSATTTSASISMNNNIPLMSMMNSNCPTSSSSPFNMPGGGGIPFNPTGFQQFPIPNEYMLAQQVAMQNWMQQAYIQYMNQYMNLLSTGVRPETVFMQNQTNSIPSMTTNVIGGLSSSLPPQMPYLPQNFPFSLMNTNTNIGSNLPGTTDSSAINPPPQTGSSTVAAAAAATAAVPVPPSHVQDQQQQQQQPQPAQQQQNNQPRFPNIMQDDFQENRDWLDVFYSISRLMVLLTLVYLYSSPIRCLLVFVIGMAIYLYHMAYFRVPRQQQDDNNNNGAQVQAAARRDAQNGDQQQQQQEVPSNLRQNNNDNSDGGVSTTEEATTAAEQENSTSETAAAASTVSANANERVGGGAPGDATVSNVAEDADGTSMIAFLKTFVVSFIVSLLPETPPV